MWEFVRLDGGKGEGAESNKLTLGTKHDARNGKHQHEGQCQQRIDCAAGNAILRKDAAIDKSMLIPAMKVF